MRAVAQRCTAARVLVAQRVVGAIGPGIVAFVGVARGDGRDDVRYLASKLAGLRIFPDAGGRLARPGRACLLVPNFTLCGDVRHGLRPDCAAAAPPDIAREQLEQLAQGLRALGIEVAEGEFGADMRVEVENDGPVTILLDSKRLF